LCSNTHSCNIGQYQPELFIGFQEIAEMTTTERRGNDTPCALGQGLGS
jgi:hypothetical protein